MTPAEPSDPGFAPADAAASSEPRRRPTVAVFGGSFDPPHVAHVLVPTWVRSMHSVDEVWVVPAAAHAFAKNSNPYEVRLAWTRAAFRAAGAEVRVSSIESELLAASPGAPVYALDLLEAVAARRPEHRVRLVVGSDIVDSAETSRWHLWPEIERRFAPIVVPRASQAIPDLASDALQGGARGQANELAGLGALPAVSSTQIRAALAALRDDAQGTPVSRGGPASREAAAALIHALVPPAVANMLLSPPRARIALIGLGHAGRPLAAWLRAHHVDVLEVHGREVLAASAASLPALLGLSQPPLDGIWLTVHDDVLASLAARLVGALPRGMPILHAAGARVARSATALGPLARAGHPVGTLHPICALRRDLEDAALHHLEYAWFGIEGDIPAVALATRLVEGERFVDLSRLDGAARVTYHAACALAANHLAVPRQDAIEAWVSIGLPAQQAAVCMDALMASSLFALQRLGVPAGVSGPAARGDAAAIAAHAAALPADGRALYESLSARLLRLLSSGRA